jgi:hypothetical protein
LNKFLLVAVVFISFVAIGSYASSASVSVVRNQALSGEIRYIYFETASGSTSTPSTNTALSPSSSSNNYKITRGSSVYLWSPQFGSSGTVGSGTWTLDLYASCAKSATLTVSFETTSSTGAVQSTIVSGVPTKSIGTSETEVVTTFQGSSGAIPAMGYIVAILTLPTGGAKNCYVYWGSGQETNFQVPYTTLTG